MDFIRMNCLMAVLTEAMIHQIKTSFSLLLSFHQSPYGSHPNEIENCSAAKFRKIFVWSNYDSISSIVAKIGKIF